ncbi:TetR/AcrR family transcriptional regulator (plasmid) [Enterocloster clostridioformis]
MVNKTTKNPTAIRSRKALAIALVNLLCEQPLKDITVEDITNSAGLSRQTFYTNFSQKEDILANSLNELFLQLSDGLCPPPDTVEEMMALYFQFWSEHQKFLSVLFDNQLSHLFAIDNTYLFRNECSIYSEKAVKSQKNLLYVENYLAGLTFQMLHTWQQNGWNEETEVIAQIACQLLKGDFFHE